MQSFSAPFSLNSTVFIQPLRWAISPLFAITWIWSTWNVYFYILLAIFVEFNNLMFSSSLIVRFCSKNSRVFWTTKFRQRIASVKWGEISLTWMIKWLNIAYCWTNIPDLICPSQRMWMKKWNTDIISLLKGYFHLGFWLFIPSKLFDLVLFSF